MKSLRFTRSEGVGSFGLHLVKDIDVLCCNRLMNNYENISQYLLTRFLPF